MPRSDVFSSSSASSNSTRPDFFSSLAALSAYCSSPRSNAVPLPQIPYTSTGRKQAEARFLVCHDFKGGYCENEFERGYTFSWWHLTDIFIYFSHHRVSLPPAAWIRTAHRAGTKILGTLIFEWDEGRKDIVKLTIGGGDAVTSSVFDVVDTSYADMLVDLCVERGFEGWLVNVEVALGIDAAQGGGSRKVGAEEHAAALVAWLSYLRAQTAKRVPGGETLWYDAVTKSGDLRWQSALTTNNLLFFNSCDGIFTDYHWRPESLKHSTSLVDSLTLRDRNEIWVGIDVFGRGVFGGGGFDSWRAMDSISNVPGKTSPTLQLEAVPRAPLTSSSISGNQLSFAIFAPGWTVESEHLNHTLSTRSGYSTWWNDEVYFWAGSPDTDNVLRERTRMSEVRKQERGVDRARQLAISLAPTAPPFRLPPFDYNAPLLSLPGSPRPLSHYRPSLILPPCPDSVFFTNFANGSGHNFFLEGSKVLESEKGWTDVDFGFAQPALAYNRLPIAWDEDAAWFGGASLRISIPSTSSTIHVPLCPINVFVTSSRPLRVSVIWKSVDNETDLDLVPKLSDHPLALASQTTSPIGTTSSAWRLTTTVFFLSPSPTFQTVHLTSFSVNVSSSTPSTSPSPILVGSLSVRPIDRDFLPQPTITNLRWSPSSSTLRWSVSHRLHRLPQPPTSISIAGKRARDTTWPDFLMFTVWFLPAGVENREEAVFLGTTSSREISVDVDLGVGSFLCRGVMEDGSMESWKDAVTCEAV